VKTRILAAILIVAAVGCRDARSGIPGAAGAPARMAVASETAMQAPAPPPAARNVSAMAPTGPQTAGVPVPTDRKVVRHGTLSLEVPDLDKALASIRAETTGTGGYITNESQGRDDYSARQGSITCRIPAGKLDATLAKLQGFGRVQSVALQADDVTEEYFDVDIRLRNQRQLEDRLLKLYDKPGNKVADLLDVEREVARVRGEIDGLDGKKRLWDSQIALSTVTVELHEPRPVIAGDGGGIFGTLRNALRSAGENLVGSIAWLIAATGGAIPIVLAAWVLWRLWRFLRARSKSRG
jgi:hypothetical protein